MQSQGWHTALIQAISHDDHLQIYNLSKQLLKEQSTNIRYLQCYIISSLKTGHSSQLLNTVFKDQIPPPLQSLYAYYLYARGDYHRSLDLLTHRPLKHGNDLLKAQNYFQLQQYDDAARLFSSLLREEKEDRDTYMTNLLATESRQLITRECMGEWEGQVKRGCPQLYFNYGLAWLGMKEYDKCMEYMDRFESTIDDNQNDRVSVKLVRDYVRWQRHGSVSAPTNIQNTLTDLNVRNVMRMNAMALSDTEQKIEDYYKVLEQCCHSDAKLTKRQSKALLLNKIILLIRKNRLAQALKTLKQYQTQYGQQYQEPQYLKCKFILLRKSPEIDTFVSRVKDPLLNLLMRVQLSRERNTLSLVSKTAHPIIKNYLFSLMLKGQYEMGELGEQSDDATVLQALLTTPHICADHAKQESIARRLLNLQPTNIEARLTLAKALLNNRTHDHIVEKQQEAYEMIKCLQPPQQINDVEYLQFIEKNIHVSKKSEAIVVDKKRKKIKKKKRIRLPKIVVEGYKGDPQRWLPKWQRKGYKKKGKKGKTQGLSTVEKGETKNTYTSAASTSTKEATKEMPRRKK